MLSKMITSACLPMTAETHIEESLPPIGFVADLEPDVRSRLTAVGQFTECPVGSLLAVQGRAHNVMSLILSGRVSVIVQAHGDLVELGLLKSGDVVGEMSLIDPLVASSTARVTEGSARLWTIEHEAFDLFVEADPKAGRELFKALGKVLCRRVRMDSELMLRKAEELRSHFLDIDY
jgi:CRP-like cAMP-binding protein